MKSSASSLNTVGCKSAARSAGLRYVDDRRPGISRVKVSTGVRYCGPDGRKVHDGETLTRIRSLAVPPAWRDVWICPDPDGHVQATGRDARGRKQYRYHSRWREVRDGVKVKLARCPETGETVILCRSADREAKEQAMHDRFSRRIEVALERLAARVARSKKRVDREQVDRQIGRILQQNQRSARRFKVRLAEDASPAGSRLEVEVDASFDDWAALSEGAYLLRSNITDWSDEQLWKAYIQLTQAEAAFRIQKDQLKVRPIWHQRADRVQAHILVCFLAFVLWKTLEMWQSRAGLGNAPRTVLEELQRIQSHDVILPTATHGEIRLRCVAHPDAPQAALLDRLGIILPKRMRSRDSTLPVPLVA